MTLKYQALVTPENMPELGHLATKLTADLKGLYRDAEVGLSWHEISDFPVPLPIANVSLSDDGFSGPVDRQGHGLQRAFIFTLLQHLARTSTNVAGANLSVQPQAEVPAAPPQAPSLILAIEEPELYQHPTKQRHFAEVLRGLSSGTLPGADGPTQIAFASHSPMFVSLAKADEIRLVRRTDHGGSQYKQCELKALDLAAVAKKLAAGWSKPEAGYSAAALIPRLHILGTELAEGFFANGVVLVEGRSDKAALTAAARLLGVSFEAAGIAILSAEGKDNLDRPLIIFRELGIPVFVIWDCDSHKKEKKPQTDLAILRLCEPATCATEAPTATFIGECYAHFSKTLEHTIIEELGADKHESCLATACNPFGLTPSNDTQKIPEVMFQTLTEAKNQGAECKTLIQVVKAIWLHILAENLSEVSSSKVMTI